MMKKYKNWGIFYYGLSMTNPTKYSKINAVLAEKGKKKRPDLLDTVETVPLEYAYNLTVGGSTSEDTVFLSELKKKVTDILGSLTPREERVLRKRFGIGLKRDYTLEEVGKELSVTRDRIRQIEARALRKLRHPSRNAYRNFVPYINELHDRRAA